MRTLPQGELAYFFDELPLAFDQLPQALGEGPEDAVGLEGLLP
jgi:hypothetical protein